MNWFKSLWLTSEEREILKKAKEYNEDVHLIPNVVQEIKKKVEEWDTTRKPYKKLIYSGKTINVIFRDGTSFSTNDVEMDTFVKVRESKTEEEILTLLSPKKEVEIKNNNIDTKEERQLVNSNNEILKNHGDFIIKDDNTYLSGVGLALPSMVTQSFIEILERFDSEKDSEKKEEFLEQYNALKMFWLKLALNSLPQSREDLLVFVKKNDVRITKNGNLVLYRRIVSKENTNNALAEFVSLNYVKQKRQKKASTNPKNYKVAQVAATGQYVLTPVAARRFTKGKIIGNLVELYKNLPEMEDNDYTSYHQHGKLTIKIGGIYSIPEEDINLDNGLCAAGGLHAAAVDYNYTGFGDIPVVVLVNPSKAITVPKDETGKLRTTEMFIACINDKPHGKHFDDGALSVFDEEYHDYTLNELEEVVKNKNFDSISVKDNLPAVSMVDVNTIKDLLRSRITKI